MMIKKIIYENRIYFFLFWLVYFSLSIYFFVERTTYADSGYYLFNIIQKENFNFEHFRYTSFLTQWLAVLAVKLNMPLKVVMLMYSLGISIYLFVIFLIINFLSAQKWHKYIYLLSILATIHHVFFFIASEIFIGNGLLLLLTVTLTTNKINEVKKFLVLGVILILLFFLHQLLMMIAVFIFALSFIHNRNKLAIIALLIAGILIMIRMVFLRDGYETSVLGGINWRTITLRTFHSGVFTKHILRNILNGHYLLPIIIIFYLFFVSSSTLYYKIVVLLIVVFNYILMMVFLRSAAFSAYIDSYLSVFFVCLWSSIILIIKDENLQDKRWINYMLIIIFLISFTCLINEKKYSNRIALLKSMMKSKESKYMYNYDIMNAEIKSISWTIPYETLLISTLENKSKTILIRETKFYLEPFWNDTTKFLGAEWTFFTPVKLNDKYFKLANEKYHQLN